MNVFAFINLELNGVYRFGGAIPAMITFLFSWSISYSKWANNNIWNRKKSKPTNESINPINPTNPNDDNNALQKIEELKRQIESLEQSIRNNDSNSETESPELSEEELFIRESNKKEAEENVKRWTKSEEELKAEAFGASEAGSNAIFYVIPLMVVLFILFVIFFG